MTIRHALTGLLLLRAMAVVQPVQAQDNYAYYGFEPDITTNYIRDAEQFRMGYIRVAIEVMLDDNKYIDVIEHHSPVLRDAFLQIFSTATERQIKSLTGRDELRLDCLERAREIMRRETGQDLIRDVIFTK